MRIFIYALIDPVTCKTRYIGRTKQSLQKRLYNHLAKTRSNKKLGKKLTYSQNWINSLIKIGTKPIIKKIIELDCSWEESYKIEQFLINKYRRLRKLTNLYDRGEGGINRKVSLETKNRISNSLKKGYRSGDILPTRTTKVFKYSLSGEFIEEYNSLKEAAEKTSISCSSISKNYKGKTLQAKGFIFKTFKRNRIKPLLNFTKGRKSSVDIVFNNCVVKFKSISEVNKTFKINRKLLSPQKCANFLYKTFECKDVIINNNRYMYLPKIQYSGYIIKNNKKYLFNSFKELCIDILKTNKKSPETLKNYCIKHKIKLKILNHSRLIE